MYDRRFHVRPCGNDLGAGWSKDQAIRSGTSRTYQSAPCPLSWRTSPCGSYRGCRGFGPVSRFISRRSLDRDHQRGWNHGTSAAINRGSQEIRYQDYLHQGPDRLSPPDRIDRRERRRGRSPYRVRTFPSHSFPPEKQWIRAYSFDKG